MKCEACGKAYRKNGIDKTSGAQKWRKNCKCDELLSPTPVLDNQLDIETVIHETPTKQQNKFVSIESKPTSQGIKRTYIMKESTIRTLQKLKILYPIGATYDQIVNEAVERLYKELSE